ncbi:MAG: ureidoglycolate lyase [Pseudomonadota bacterium]
MITASPLSVAAFAPFGDLIELSDGPFKTINQGRCHRFHDLAALEFTDGRAGISLFHADVRQAPYAIELMERHPDGSQCFVPMQGSAYIVAVAPDDAGRPGQIHAFQASGAQAVNYHRNTWHAVLTPISGSGLFAVIDRIGPGANLEEHWFDTPKVIELNET